MNRNKKLGFKKIAGCFLLVLALHYLLDEPTRSPPVRSALAQLSHMVRSVGAQLNRIVKPKKASVPKPVLVYQPLLDNPSFEQWEGHPNPVLRGWFSQVTIGVSAVVKQETEVVQHGLSAVRLEHDGVGHGGNVRRELPRAYIPWLRGRRLKFSAWALSATPGAPCLHITINDDVDSKACLERPSGTWQPVNVEHTIGPDATRVELMIDISREAAGEIVAGVYVDNTALTTYLPSSEVPGATAVTAPPPPPLSEQR